MSAQTKTLRWWAMIVLLMTLAFGTRVWNLSSVPTGLTHDEASNGHDSAAILEGEHRIYFPVGYGHEPLYNYSVAVTTYFLGQGIFTLRITTVAWGLLQCILTAALARRWWGRQATVFVLATYCASFWALMLSRVGLRAPTLPALLAGSVLAYDHAIHPRAGRPSWPWYALSGLCLGAGFYTYMASRGMPLLYVVLLIVLAIIDRPTLRRVWAGTLALLAITALVGAPLFLYLRANPELEQRIGQLGSAITAVGEGVWQPLWTNISDSLPMLFTSADPQWLYNVAGRPGLEPLLAGLFVVGLGTGMVDVIPRKAQSLRKGFGPVRSVLLLTWIAGGVAPALLTAVDYNLLHAIAAMPAVMLTVALGAKTLSDWAAMRVGHTRRLKVALALLACGAFAGTVAETAHAYFVTWAGNRNVHVAYHQHVVALGRYLDQSNDQRPVVMTSLYPGEYHDPYTMEVTLRREDLSLRWADGRDALFVPTQDARLVIEEQTQPPDALGAWIAPDLAPLETLRFREDDIPATVQIYGWDAPASWQRLTNSLSRDIRVQAGDPPPGEPHVAGETPVGFADTVTLVGYLWDSAASAPGSELALLTAWQVEAATDLDLAIFAHLLTEDGSLITQDDRMAAPPWQWQPGDRFAHVHRLALPADMAPGSYTVSLGLYDRATLIRLPLHTEPCCTDPQATRLLLPLEVLER